MSVLPNKILSNKYVQGYVRPFVCSDYKNDKTPCGNSLFTKKANIGRVISILDIIPQVGNGVYKLGFSTLKRTADTIHGLVFLLITPAAKSFFNEKTSKVSFKIIKIHLSEEQAQKFKQQLGIKKNLSLLLKSPFLLVIDVSRTLISKTLLVAFDILGIGLPEISRRCRLFNTHFLDIFWDVCTHLKDLNSLIKLENSIKNPHEILGLEKNATTEEIKKKYKELVLQYHPDKTKDVEKVNKFIEIQKAYDFLIDQSSLSIKKLYQSISEKYFNKSDETLNID
jgi:DnaJ-domain-containing protein 1